MIDEALKEWATPAQARYIDAINDNDGNQRAAAKALGVHRKMLYKGLKAVEKKAAAHGYAPDYGLNSRIPAPFVARGHSTLERVHSDGSREQMLQWTKTRLDDKQYQEMLRIATESFVNDNVPSITPTNPGPLDYDTDIIPWIQIGDAHLGMLAHAAETGQNFDLKIAKEELSAAFSILIDELPNTERLVINDLGDFTHYENMSGTTEASGHALDYDGRFPKMIKVYSGLMRWMVEKALTKAKFVDVLINRGNHSETNDIWMAEMIRQAFEHTGRVHVIDNSTVFMGYRMGKTLVMTHHGHKCPPARLIGVMITDFREDFGETEFHYIDMGHIHHKMQVKEHPSITVESWNNLAPLDKWAHDGGYRSRQCMSTVLRSKTYGEVGRRTLPIQEVRARLSLKCAPMTRRAFAA